MKNFDNKANTKTQHYIMHYFFLKFQQTFSCAWTSASQHSQREWMRRRRAFLFPLEKVLYFDRSRTN